MDDAFSRHYAKIRANKSIPHDEYAHSIQYADSEREEKQEELIKFSSIVDMYVQQANVQNDKLMGVYQEQAEELIHLCDMALRDSIFEGFFRMAWNQWRSKMLLTRASKGKLSDQLAAVGRYKAAGGGISYGEQMPVYPMQPEEEQSFFDKLFNRKKKGGENVG